MEIVLGRMDCISEGQRESRAGRATWHGSTMLTIDLGTLGDAVRETCDAGTARRVAALLEADAEGLAALKKRATAEVARQAGKRPTKVATEVRVRAQGTRVLVDVDVEAAL